MVIIVFQTIELIWELAKFFIYKIPESGLNYVPQSAANIVILLFNVLLSLEIKETIRDFKGDHEEKIKIIFIVSLIAVSRRVLSMEIEHASTLETLASQALILAFSFAYFLIKWSGKKKEIPEKKSKEFVGRPKSVVN